MKRGTTLGSGSARRQNRNLINKFTLDSALNLFGTIKHEDYDMDKKKIEQCFQFSMMTVLNEHTQMHKYDSLTFVEFLDLLCRIVIIGVTKEDTVDYKAHFLLEIIYEKLYRSGEIDRENHPLRPVDEDLR